MKGNKKGAMEMSIGTIVIIVLAMSMLILGMILLKNIFSGATDITDMTNNQVKHQISQLFGEEKKLVVYPSSKEITVKSGERNAFAVGIQNLLTATTGGEFWYSISVVDLGNCPVSENDLMGLIVTGKEISPTEISPGGEPVVRKVTLSVPEGFPLCSFSYKIESFYDGSAYATEFMDVTVKA